MKTLKTSIEFFNGGMAGDPRDASSNQVGNVENFRVERKKLIPNRSTEAIEDTTYDIRKFVYAPNNSGYSLYGLGKVVGDTEAQVYEITNPTADAPTWSTALGGGGATDARDTLVFSYYKNYIYMWEANARLIRFGSLTGSRSITSYQTIAYTNLAEPVHHPADDIMYFFADEKVYSLDNTTWNGEVQTIPDSMRISSCTAYGNYLAIGGSPVVTGSGTKSTVFLWNRDSSSTLFSHKYEVGAGDLKVLATVGGKLVAIVDEYMTDAIGNFRGRAVIYELEANGFVEKWAINHTPQSEGFHTDYDDDANCNKLETGSAVYWAMKAVRGDDIIAGIWKYDSNGAVSVEFVEEDADADGINGFFKLGNFWWVAHSNSGEVNRTDNTATFNFTSKVDTPVIGDGIHSWQTKGFTVVTEPLPSDGQIVVKYRKDNEATFSTALFTSNTDGQIRHEVPETLLPIFKENVYRVESTGGAIITGIYAEHHEIKDSRYK